MWPFKGTPKPSETSLLCSTITELATELRLQAESYRKLSEKLLDMNSEKDSQIRLVLESKFQQYVVSPTVGAIQGEPESTEYLADVSEMSEASAEIQAAKDTKRYNVASEEFEKELEAEFLELAAEHENSHRQGAEA